MLGQDGVHIFFKRMTTAGHQAQTMFEQDIVEKCQRIQELAREEAKNRTAEESKEVECIQLHPLERGASINIQVPQAGSADDEVKKARAIFETFSP
jgi:cell division cycle protein 37